MISALLQWHELVGVAVNNQCRRIVCRYMVDRRNLLANFFYLRLVRNQHKVVRLGIQLREIERSLKILQDAAAQRVFAGLP